VHIYEKPPLGTGFAGPLHFGGMLSAKFGPPTKFRSKGDILIAKFACFCKLLFALI